MIILKQYLEYLETGRMTLEYPAQNGAFSQHTTRFRLGPGSLAHCESQSHSVGVCSKQGVYEESVWA